jgi:hypothetical protein
MDFIGFVLREGSEKLPPPRDCDRDESRMMPLSRRRRNGKAR